jgi:hypothetical protein
VIAIECTTVSTCLCQCGSAVIVAKIILLQDCFCAVYVDLYLYYTMEYIYIYIPKLLSIYSKSTPLINIGAYQTMEYLFRSSSHVSFRDKVLLC